MAISSRATFGGFQISQYFTVCVWRQMRDVWISWRFAQQNSAIVPTVIRSSTREKVGFTLCWDKARCKSPEVLTQPGNGIYYTPFPIFWMRSGPQFKPAVPYKCNILNFKFFQQMPRFPMNCWNQSVICFQSINGTQETAMQIAMERIWSRALSQQNYQTEQCSALRSWLGRKTRCLYDKRTDHTMS